MTSGSRPAPGEDIDRDSQARRTWSRCAPAVRTGGAWTPVPAPPGAGGAAARADLAAPPQSELEDTELELMEQRETAQERVAELTARVDDAPASHRGRGATPPSPRSTPRASRPRPARSRRRPAGRPGHPLRQDPRARPAASAWPCSVRAAAADAGWSSTVRSYARVRAAAADEVVRCEDCRRIMVRARGVRALCLLRSSSRPTAAPAAILGLPATARWSCAPDGTVLAERAGSLGTVTNNVAEYSGLIAGLEAARDARAPRG